MAEELEYWAKGEDVSLRDAFGRVLLHAGAMRDDWVLLDADVAGGTGAKPFTQDMPERVMQFGIAEQNMMAAASGVADSGLIPVVSTFAAFGTMRAHEQFRTAVCYGQRNVKLCCSHHGLDVGPDGATAQALEDLATMRAIPDVTVISPADANEFMAAFHAVLDHIGPVYMRIGRSATPVLYDGPTSFTIGKADRLREGDDVTIIATGVMVARSLQAAETLKAEGINARVVNMATIKPLDNAEVIAAARETGAIVTAEDHSIIGGLGGAVAECLAAHQPALVEFVGIKDEFGKSGEHDELPALFGIDAAGVVAACKRAIARK